MNEAAISFAKQQEDLLRRQLADMYNNLTATKESSIAEAESRRNELLARIEQSREPINEQFATDTRSAYVNKMLGGNTINDLLARMGLSGSGFGVGQQLANETSYGQNLASLSNVRNRGLQDLTNQGISAEKAYNTELAGINTNYLQNKLGLDKYINEASRNTYETAYANYINEQRYQDQLKQQGIENYYRSLSVENSKPKNYTNQPMPYTVGATGTPTSNGQVKYTGTDGSTYTFAAGINPWVGQYNPAVLTNGVFDPSKAFNGANGGYQPNKYNGNKLSKTGVQVQTAWGNQQNVWKAGNTYVVWNGPANRYDVLTKAEKKQAGLK